MLMKHSDSKRDEILRAAIRLFARQGIAGTTVKEIGKEAGVTDAALYKHFPGKEAVALAVCSHYADQFSGLIQTVAAQREPFPRRLDALVEAVVAAHDLDPFGLMLLSERHEAIAKQGAEHPRPVRLLMQFIARGVEEGELPPQDAKVSAAMLAGALLRLAVFSDLGFLPRQLAQDLPEIQRRIRGLVGLQ